MKMPHVIPDPILNPSEKDWIPACAGMTMYFHVNHPPKGYYRFSIKPA